VSTLTWQQDGDVVRLSGRIDENADLSRLASAIPPGARLDLGGINRLNSIGVREWMDFATSAGAKGLQLVRCAPVFVDQLNAIANFAGATEIVSVLAAFECEQDSEVTVLEVQAADARSGRFPAAPACPRCGVTMIASVEDDLYYRFLRYG
jgi:eukaryotic-like serine/threonine-protein kinase